MKGILTLFIVFQIMLGSLDVFAQIGGSSQFSGMKKNRYLAIKVKPNPAKTKVTVRLAGLYSVKNIESFYLSDLLGRRITDYTETARKYSNGSNATFDLYISEVNSGAYLLVLQADTFLKTTPIAICH